MGELIIKNVELRILYIGYVSMTLTKKTIRYNNLTLVTILLIIIDKTHNYISNIDWITTFPWKHIICVTVIQGLKQL